MPCVCNIKQCQCNGRLVVSCANASSLRSWRLLFACMVDRRPFHRHPPCCCIPVPMERLGRVGDHVVKQDGAAEPSPASALEPVDLLIVGGRVICPASQIDAICDVAVKDGVIAAVGEDLGKRMAAATVHDATGQLVTPGLVDAHGHL